MRSDCEICRGSGNVRLPVYRHALASFSAREVSVAPTMEESIRQFPCPECSDVVTIGRVGALREEALADSRYSDDPAFVDHMKEGLAHSIVARLLKDGYIEFKRGPVDTRDFRFGMRATVAVAHPSKLDTLEERISARQTTIAQEAIADAKAEIDNWGSHYGRSEISKIDARRLIGESLRRVLDKRVKGWKKPDPAISELI